VLMVSDEVQMIVHKKPDGGGLSAVGGNSIYTFFEPGCAEYAGLEKSLMTDIPKLMEAMDLVGEPLPLLWTTDFIPKDAEDGTPGVTEYVVGEFNCSCVGVSKFQAVCGGDKTMADVSDEDYFDACKLTDLVGRKAVQILDQRISQPESDPPRKTDFPDASPAERKALVYLREKVDPIFAPLLKQILLERPTDVAQFVVDKLRS